MISTRCGVAIQSSGRRDRFLDHAETFSTVVNLESEIDETIVRARQMEPDIAAAIGPGFRDSFLRDYYACMQSGR